MNKQPIIFSFLFLLLLSAGYVALGNDRERNANYGNEYDSTDVLFYHLNLNVSDSSTYIAGSTSILLKSLVPSLHQVALDCSDLLTADSVKVSNTKVQYTHLHNQLKIYLVQPVSSGNIINIEVYYHGLGKNSAVSSGIYNKNALSWDKRVTWTLSEPFSALNFFPCKQSLTDKADSVYVFLSTDDTLKAGSNGLLTAQVPLPGNRIRYEWKSRIPVAYYLISFTVSDYMDYSFYARSEDGQDSILIQNYIYNDSTYLEQNKAAIDKTSDLILLFSELFGDYPFRKEKYGHCTAPFGGGMEHQTMTTLVNFSFLLVAHELAHQWFGDYVTCSTWPDIWINEGFASYAEYIASQHLRSQVLANSWITGCQRYVKSSPDGSVYVPESYANDEDRIFDDRLTYKKGAAIIHMIRQEIGNDSLFFHSLSGFLEKYKEGNASGTDFKNYLEEVTGIDWDPFFDQWYFGQGYPIHSINWYHTNDTLYINSLQSVSSVTPYFNVLLEFKINYNSRDTTVAFRQSGNYNAWQLYLPGAISSIEADPQHWLLIELPAAVRLQPEYSEKRMRIIPNPARHIVNIYFTSPSGNYSLYLVNSSGQILSIRESEKEHEVIDIQSYPPGVYFIIIKDKNAIYKSRFIIN